MRPSLSELIVAVFNGAPSPQAAESYSARLTALISLYLCFVAAFILRCSRRRLRNALALAAVSLAAPSPAAAGSCSLESTGLNFGALPLQSLQGAATSGTIAGACTPDGGGSAPVASSPVCDRPAVSSAVRSMTGGGQVIAYELTNTLGLSFSGLSAMLTNPGASLAAPIQARVLSAGPDLRPGTYTDSLPSVFAYLWPDLTTGPGVCAGPGVAWRSRPFTVSVTLLASCSVSATNMVFPGGASATSPVAATSTLSVACTRDTAWQLGLSAGQGAGATVGARRMTGPGGETVDYVLYRDAAHTQVWGDAAGADTLAGVGAGTAQSLTVYGLAPAQNLPPPGLYTDTINVTLTY